MIQTGILLILAPPMDQGDHRVPGVLRIQSVNLGSLAAQPSIKTVVGWAVLPLSRCFPLFRIGGLARPVANCPLRLFSMLVIGFMTALPLIGLSDEKAPETDPPLGYEEAPGADPPPGYEEAPEAGNVAVVEGGAEVAMPDVVDLNGNVNPNVLELEKQLLSQYKHILDTELAFIQRVCQPTKEQHLKIFESGNRSLKQTVHQIAIAQVGMIQGQRGNIAVVDSAIRDPNKMIQAGLAQAIQEHLHPAQAKRYHEEADNRSEHIKRVTVLNLVAEIDHRLVLSTEQRDRLVKLLSSNWQENWANSLQLFMHNNQYLPIIPDQYVVPILTATQKRIWHSIPKQGQAVWGGNLGFLQPMVVWEGDVIVEPFEAPAVDAEQAEVDQQEEN